MKKHTKLMLLAIAMVMLVSITVMNVSANSWKFAGYDNSDLAIANNEFAKMWYEVDEKGLATGNQKNEGFAASADWKIDFYEAYFPHAGVQRLWLDGIATSATRYSGTTANWETKFSPLFWEVKYPYNIYEGLYSNINGRWVLQNEYPGMGITNSDVRKFLGKEAKVVSEYKPFGFGSFEVIGNNVVRDASAKYDAILGYVPSFPTGSLTTAALSAKVNGVYSLSDTDIAEMITSYDSEYLTGPHFATGGTNTIDSVSYWYNNGSPLSLSWFNPHLIMDSDRATTVSWTSVQYEKAYPYNYYQFLIVNGVVLDGRTENGATLPRVFRYTGGTANPKVTYVYAFTEKDPDYKVIMEKCLDGVPTGELYFLEERANQYGVVNYAIPALDNKAQSVYGTAELDNDAYSGLTPGYSVVPSDVAQKIKAAADASMR